MCVCVCVLCVCVCVFAETTHMVSNTLKDVYFNYRGFDALLFYIMLIALKAV